MTTVRIFCGDALAELRKLPDESVHCCVTSPPYWRLRDYGTARWEGGDDGCNHRQQAIRIRGKLAEAANLRDGGHRSQANRGDEGPLGLPFPVICGKCGARRIDKQLGLERTPEEYVARLVEVFREVRRVLRKDGTLWLNMGDSYANDRKWGGKSGAMNYTSGAGGYPRLKMATGLKPKDQVGIPWRVALALQADGWYLRADVIWSKPNAMPESVTDRPTKAHEYLFLLAKSERYYYDAEAIAEPAICGDPRKAYAPGQIDARGNGHDRGGGKIRPSVARGGFNGKTEAMSDEGRNALRSIKDWRNRRSVWTIGTQSYPEAHFATFPEALVEPPIKAGCPSGGTVLDPFCGSGTTLLVARRLGCNSIGIDLKPEYGKLAEKRLAQQVLDLGCACEEAVREGVS